MTALNIASENHEPKKTLRRRIRNTTKEICTPKTVKRRLPIIEWLPKYTFATLIQDIIAGITVGLTAIPQGIAYAVVAGLPPEYGLYAGLTGGFVYLLFGSCKDITVGPTAIMSTMTAKYVSSYSSDFAVLAAFLCGIVELSMGVLHLGFLVEFISIPVICGFTNSAAMQIAAAQLKSLFGLGGSSGNNFGESMYNFVNYITTARLWDSLLGFSTIVMLLLLKKLGEGCKRTDGAAKQLRWFISLGRNAVVIIIGIIIAYILNILTDDEPLILIGDIGSGIPKFAPPPFSTVVGNQTYNFQDMLEIFGPQSIVLPLVAILESVAIAKAFAEGKTVDATQEMIAIGFCNIVGSFVRSMPVTGSFTRTALNNASGVQTPAGGIFTGLLILSALSLLTSTFYFIPKASLAGLIITAMFSMLDYTIFVRLWRNSKKELFVLLSTMAVCLFVGLEYGIITGVIIEACMLLFMKSRPTVEYNLVRNIKGDMVVIPLVQNLSYCAAEHIRRAVLKASKETSDSIIIIDGTNLRSMDSTVASNLMTVATDLSKESRLIICLNFSNDLIRLCLDINPEFMNNFIVSSTYENVAEILVNRK